MAKTKTAFVEEVVIDRKKEIQLQRDLVKNESFKEKIFIVPTNAEYSVDQMTSASQMTCVCKASKYELGKVEYPISFEEFFSLKINEPYKEMGQAEKVRRYENFFHPDNFKVQLTGKPVIFDMESEIDKLRLKMIELFYSDVVCLDGKAQSNHKFLLVNQEKEAEVAIDSYKHKVKAFAKIEDMQLSDMNSVLTVLGYPSYGQSQAIVTHKLCEMIEKDARKVLQVMESSRRKEHEFLLNLVNSAIISKKGKSFFYNETLLGASIEEAIDFLARKDNQYVYLELKETLKEKSPLYA